MNLLILTFTKVLVKSLKNWKQPVDTIRGCYIHLIEYSG